MDEKTNRSDSTRRANLRTAMIVGLIALAGYAYTIVQGIVK